MVSFGFDESTSTLQARNPSPSPSPGSSMLQPWLQPETRWRRGTSRRSRGRSSGGPARTRRSALGGSDAFGHPGRSVGCLRSRAARVPIRTRAPYFAADAGVSSSAAGARRLPKGSRRAVGAAGSARTARDRVASVGPKGRQVASAGRLCRRRRCAEPAGRAVPATAGGPCLRRRSTGAGSRRHRRPRGRRHLPRRHQLSALLVARGRSVRTPPLAYPAPPARGVAP